ncbi:hypothetical protein HF259_37015 [Rhizobium leguminosarum]|nr:hypothetical protein [Rhizobium leguminosarum]
MARDFLAVPKLAAVLADWSPRLPGLLLHYPGNRHVPSALRAFIDLLQARSRRLQSQKGGT